MASLLDNIKDKLREVVKQENEHKVTLDALTLAYEQEKAICSLG
jgi:hypothetical protein